MSFTVDNSDPDGRRTLTAGTLIGRYKVLELIEVTAGGEVYRAEDTQLKRTVAVKLLSRSLAADRDFRERFQLEARSAASLNHRNIVALYDYGEYQNRPYAAMEFASGKTVQEMLDEGSIELRRTCHILAQVCDGLQAAHKERLIHRDVKPGNVVVDDRGCAKLLDFGLAGPPRHTAPGAEQRTTGTLAYMSPEQATGASTDFRSDLFSVGVMLYRMLSGRLPFGGEYEAAIRYAIANEPHVPITEYVDDLPPRCAALVERLLEKEPQNRPRSAGEVAKELRALSGDGGRPEKIKRVTVRAVALVAIIAAISQVPKVVNLVQSWLLPETTRKMLAVLPFENIGKEQDEYFADGMTSEITARLASIRGLGVISRTSTISYKGTTKPVRVISDELNVDYVVEGTVRWDRSTGAEKVRIIPQLVRGSDETTLWSARYEEDLTEVFRIQSDIAEQIARELDIKLQPDNRREFELPPTRNLEAYGYYLQGNEYFYRSWDAGDIEIAIDLYTHAVELDSLFARAWAMLCRGHESMYWEYFDPSPDRLQLAQQAVDRALALQPDLMEAHLAHGYLFYHRDRDYDKALQEFELALNANPNSSELLNAIAAVQRRQGKLAESAANFIQAFELNPRSHINAFETALTYGMMRHYDSARVYLAKAQQLAPDWPLAYIFDAWLHVIRNGNTASARRVLVEASGRCDLWQSKYYWWLTRIVEDDYAIILNRMRPGPDTVDYYLECARFSRLLADTAREYDYSVSALKVLEAQGRTTARDAKTLMYLGLAYAGFRDSELSLQCATMAVEQLPTTRDAFDALFLAVDYAEVLMIFGRREQAMQQLRHLASIPGFVSPAYLRLDPLWDPLRDLPEFKELIAAKDRS